MNHMDLMNQWHGQGEGGGKAMGAFPVGKSILSLMLFRMAGTWQ